MEQLSAQQWKAMLTANPADPSCCRFCGKITGTLGGRSQHEYLHVRCYKCTEEPCQNMEWTTLQRARRHNYQHQVQEVFHPPRRLLQGSPLKPEWQTVYPSIRLQRVRIPEALPDGINHTIEADPTPNLANLKEESPEAPLSPSLLNLISNDELDWAVAELMNTEPGEEILTSTLNLDLEPTPMADPMWGETNPHHHTTHTTTVSESIQQRTAQLEADLIRMQELLHDIRENQKALQDLYGLQLAW